MEIQAWEEGGCPGPESRPGGCRGGPEVSDGSEDRAQIRRGCAVPVKLRHRREYSTSKFSTMLCLSERLRGRKTEGTRRRRENQERRALGRLAGMMERRQAQGNAASRPQEERLALRINAPRRTGLSTPRATLSGNLQG